jgi:hypothetical protein
MSTLGQKANILGCREQNTANCSRSAQWFTRQSHQGRDWAVVELFGLSTISRASRCTEQLFKHVIVCFCKNALLKRSDFDNFFSPNEFVAATSISYVVYVRFASNGDIHAEW